MKLFDEAFVLKDQMTGKPFAQTAYRIKRADGTYEYGITDDDGKTHLVSAVDTESLSIELIQER